MRDSGTYGFALRLQLRGQSWIGRWGPATFPFNQTANRLDRSKVCLMNKYDSGKAGMTSGVFLGAVPLCVRIAVPMRPANRKDCVNRLQLFIAQLTVRRLKQLREMCQ